MKSYSILSLILLMFILSLSSAQAQIQWQGTSIHEAVFDLQWHNNKSYLLTKTGFYTSTDEITWQKLLTITDAESYGSPVVLESGEMFLFGYNYYKVSTDGGANWTRVSEPNFSTRLCIADNGGNLYAGQNDPIYLSADKGKTWTKSEKGTSTNFFDIGVIVLGPDGAVYAGNQGITGGMVYRSTDNGGSWKLLHNENMTDVSVIAVDTDRMWVAYYPSKLIYSDDKGAHWKTAALTPHPIQSLLFTDKNNGLAGMYDVGLVTTSDGGNTWTPAMSGIHAKYVYGITRSAHNIFYCMTDSGLFYYTPQAGVKEGNPASAALVISPNPAREEVRIEANFSTDDRFTLELYDETGRKLLSEERKGQDEMLSTTSLKNGSYLVITRSKDHIKTGKFIIIK